MIRKFTLCFLLFLPLFTFAQKDYKGAELYSLDKWKYGKIDIRMKMAKGSGILSTFFTYKDGSEQQGAFWEEIDIEVFGKNNAETFQSNIISNNPRVMSEEVHSPGFSLGDDYHTYTLAWTPDYVAWFLDGKQMRKSENDQVDDLTNSQSFRMNIWASNAASWVGDLDVQALPAYQFVNWMKYSAYTPGKGDNGSDFMEEWVDNFDSLDESKWGRANWTFNENLVDFDPDNIVVKDGYLVLVISEAGKTGFEGAVPVDIAVSSTKESKTASGINVFPNPVSSRLYVQGSADGKWMLQNAVGENVKQGAGAEINLEDVVSGIYFLNIDNSMIKIIKD